MEGVRRLKRLQGMTTPLTISSDLNQISEAEIRSTDIKPNQRRVLFELMTTAQYPSLWTFMKPRNQHDSNESTLIITVSYSVL